MSSDPESSAPPQSQLAMLPVRDLKRTIAWYRKLGFMVGDLFGNPPEWCCLCYDDARLFFKQAPTALPPPDGESASANAHPPLLAVHVDDLAAAHAEFVGRGLGPTEISRPTEGSAEFELRDCDGYRLWFSEGTLDSADEAG